MAHIIGVLLEELGLADLGAGELATDGRESVESCENALSQSGAYSSGQRSLSTYRPSLLFLL